jgi:hypothetical protein
MQDIRTPEQEAAEDIFFGQLVIIWARWSVIAVGIMLVAWAGGDLGTLTLNIVLVVALMVMNFFLHGAYTLEKPQNRMIVTVVSLLDLAVVTLIVAFWPEKQGFASPFFVLYYPFVLAFALVFPRRVAAIYTLVAIAAYVAVSTFGIGLDLSAEQLKTLLMRAITLAATGGLATYYWRIQRDRRRAALGFIPSHATAPKPKLSPAQP